MEENRNEIEVLENQEVEVEETKTGMGTGVAMVIGAGIATGLYLGGKKVRGMIKRRKLRKLLEEELADDCEYVDGEVDTEEDDE